MTVKVLIKGPTLQRPTCRGPRCPRPWRWRGRRCWTWRRTPAGWWWSRSALSPSCSPGCHRSRHTAGRWSGGNMRIQIGPSLLLWNRHKGSFPALLSPHEIVVSIVRRSSSCFIIITSSANKKSSLLTSVFLSCAKILCFQYKCSMLHNCNLWLTLGSRRSR